MPPVFTGRVSVTLCYENGTEALDGQSHNLPASCAKNRLFVFRNENLAADQIKEQMSYLSRWVRRLPLVKGSSGI
jgi:hypothetical protein